ncbi:LysR substrate-binding domain-containing protein [Sedimentitalea nanhaiensis]|uniref:DNA-binding transcriptional regulator, LysR family n=1 Tax=Sedimentitalea nanhaiensis TaxID=999627 RepID=A0A1I7C3K7_9RHOB|nr:LysR substrate-binding domain-containing protein [Sedimentitalea nanhaiensis]SFT93996.1 DNA-binding transcriptional regulator, LysR family [Sedimentitalea nanhaiensis]
MSKGKSSLPPLDYLLAFEAAAECESFVGASKKLNISETAISRKVRLLELHHDVTLFLRGHRSISLTPQGVSYLSRIQPALRDLREASSQIVAQQKNKPVTLAATNSVASLWLMPRLRDFSQTSKHVKIKLVASDNDEECLSETVDLAILRGDGRWPGFEARMLFGETVFPVCSPDYLQAHPRAGDLETLPQLDLIEVSSSHREWMNWKTWLRRAGGTRREPTQAVLFNTYPLSIQAAVDGLGIALGWGHLVDPYIEQGKLVRPVESVNVRTEYGYYLLKSENALQSDDRQVVEDWLMGISKARHRYGAIVT